MSKTLNQSLFDALNQVVNGYNMSFATPETCESHLEALQVVGASFMESMLKAGLIAGYTQTPRLSILLIDERHEVDAQVIRSAFHEFLVFNEALCLHEAFRGSKPLFDTLIEVMRAKNDANSLIANSVLSFRHQGLIDGLELTQYFRPADQQDPAQVA